MRKAGARCAGPRVVRRSGHSLDERDEPLPEEPDEPGEEPAPAMELVNGMSGSSIPALGYAGTYAVANVLLTLAGTLIIAFWF